MAWPLYVGGALGVGALGYFLWPSDKKRHHDGGGDVPPSDDASAAQPPDLGPGDTKEAAPSEAETDSTPVDVPNSPAPATPKSDGFHPGPSILPPAAMSVAHSGRASKAAGALHQYLSSYGPVFSEGLHRVTLAFQRAHNTDPLAIRLAGRLPRTGHYDPRTSAALTMYTGSPIPASPDAVPAPPPPFHHILNPNVPGNAAMAGYNMGVDLRKRGVVHDERQKRLIREYQRQINRDPKFPGAAWARGTPALFRSRIREHGRYDTNTARALRLQSHSVPLPSPPAERPLPPPRT